MEMRMFITLSEKHTSNLLLFSKFKFTEGQFLKYKSTAKVKLPEIRRAIDLIQHISKTEGALETRFQISDGLYGLAEIPEGSKKVGLWLGAEVMVEYNLEEAEKLLQSNLEKALSNIKTYV